MEQAHYLVMQARELRGKDDVGAASRNKKLLRRALRVHSGSVEAWIELVVHVFLSGDGKAFSAMLSEALERVEPRLRFLLLEGLIQAHPGFAAASWRSALDEPVDELGDHQQLLLAAVDVIKQGEPDVVLHYYGAWILLLCNQYGQARVWLEKCLLLEPDFWLARLELFALAREEQSLTPFFSDQLDFFIERARRLKRFVCSNCGLKRESMFFLCPKCSSWRSIVFRTDLTP